MTAPRPTIADLEAELDRRKAERDATTVEPTPDEWLRGIARGSTPSPTKETTTP